MTCANRTHDGGILIHAAQYNKEKPEQWWAFNGEDLITQVISVLAKLERELFLP